MTKNILNNENFKKKFPIVLVPHNNVWREWYKEEKDNILELLGVYQINIYQIGSTAIPYIYSKNIVDILIEVLDNKNFNDIINLLSTDWELRWIENNSSFLVKGYGEDGFLEKVFHLHVRKKGDINEVYFKDILLRNPEIAKRYEKLKLDLEIKYKYDRESYTNGKTKLIKEIEKHYSLHK